MNLTFECPVCDFVTPIKYEMTAPHPLPGHVTAALDLRPAQKHILDEHDDLRPNPRFTVIDGGGAA